MLTSHMVYTIRIRAQITNIYKTSFLLRISLAYTSCLPSCLLLFHALTGYFLLTHKSEFNCHIICGCQKCQIRAEITNVYIKNLCKRCILLCVIAKHTSFLLRISLAYTSCLPSCLLLLHALTGYFLLTHYKSEFNYLNCHIIRGCQCRLSSDALNDWCHRSTQQAMFGLQAVFMALLIH